MLRVGSRVGDYELEAPLGEGGMATVYRARHVHLGSRWALKVLDPRYRDRPDARRRFLDEARIQHTHLDHPNIVKVTGLVATDEHAALVMELVEGGTLEDELPRLRGRHDEIRRLMAGVLAGVGHAHAAGIVHRDLKPANVLLAREGGRLVPRVADFGIAKLSAELAAPGKKSTAADGRMGTLTYMSPEQIKRAKDVTPRSDIFSLGAMLYELVTGAPPFDGDSDYDVMDAILHGRYLPPEEREPSIDPNLAAVIRQALATDPSHRFGRCEAMAAALGAARPVATAPPRRVPTPVPAREPTPVPAPPARDPTPAATMLLPVSLPPHPAETRTTSLTAVTTRTTAPGGRRTRVAVGAGAAGGALLIATIALVASSGDDPAPAPHAGASTASTGGCPAGMVRIPGATFWMGARDDDAGADEHPRHRVTLSPYCLDRTEVTVRAYLDRGGRLSPGARDEDVACNHRLPGRDAHPMNCVSWRDASAYCESLGRRLPTEAEWELAAGGPGSWRYPWGDSEPEPSRLNWRGLGDGFEQTAPVGSFPAGASTYGVQDLAGNVYEWVADEYVEGYPAGAQVDPPAVTTRIDPNSKRHVVRGGSWLSSRPVQVRVARRAYFGAFSARSGTGFRCARDPL